MPNKYPLMRLSREEELFLRRWMYDEVHYQEGPGPAKQLQLAQGAIPGELATLIAAAIPEPSEQEAAGLGPPPAEAVVWPWSEAGLRKRLVEARAALSGQQSTRAEEAETNLAN